MPAPIEFLTRRLRVGLALLFLLGLVDCAGTPLRSFDPSRAIEIKEGRYEQDGEPLARADLIEGLKGQVGEADASSAAEQAQVLGTLGMVVAVPGGAMIGYPLGQALGGDEHPRWSVAAIGAGVAVAGIALGFGADAALASAVKSHNHFIAAKPVPANARPRAAPVEPAPVPASAPPAPPKDNYEY
jgi:hypothetical protein